MKPIKQFILICIVVMFLYIDIAKGAKNMLQDKPFLTVHLNTSKCTHEVRMNDVPLLPDNGRSVGSDVIKVPVNHWVKSGENELSVKIFPIPKEESIANAQIELAFQVEPFEGNDPDKKFTIATINYIGNGGEDEENKVIKSSVSGTFDENNEFKKDENGNVVVGDIIITGIKENDIDGVKVSRIISLPLPFPEWKWFSSDLIDNNEETKLDLWKQYLKIFNNIKNKEFDAIYSMFDEYKEEHAIAMYNPSLKKDPTYMADNANNPDYELFEIQYDNHIHVKLLVFGNNRLAKIVIAHDYSTLIGYNIKGGGSHNHPFVFRKDGEKWIYCR